MKDFYLFVFLTSCIAAGGYLLNDLVDIKGDQYNQKRSFINQGWEKRAALLAYGVITICPIPFAFSLASEIGHPEYFWYYVIVVGLLIIYNVLLKRIALMGNIVVATLCAGVLWMFMHGEQESLSKLYEVNYVSYMKVQMMAIFYYVFAFISNLSREIVKDVQDMPGDTLIGAKTLPIVVGVKVTRWTVFMLSSILLAFSIYWLIHYTVQWVLILSFILLVIAPNIYMIWIFSRSIPIVMYQNISNHFKLWMITGIIFIFIASFNF